MDALKAWFKKWILDGWITEGPQIGCAPGEVRAFATCYQCQRIYPHWLANMTAAEVKKRGHIGCKCGGIRIQPTMIPSWKAAWWVIVRGWFIRKVLLGARMWDPRMPIMWKDLA